MIYFGGIIFWTLIAVATALFAYQFGIDILEHGIRKAFGKETEMRFEFRRRQLLGKWDESGIQAARELAEGTDVNVNNYL